jgi:2-keto-4-pentenoate hydratase/2-oxohepta-3-ene-1,7-dioic acid hydratase in catechol pathway
VRLVTFEHRSPSGTLRRAGALLDGGIVDLHAAAVSYLTEARRHPKAAALAACLVPPDVLGIIEGGDDGMDLVRRSLEHAAGRLARDGDPVAACVHWPADVRLLAPIPRPASMRDCLGFETHVRDGRRRRGLEDIPDVWYRMPVYYKGNPASVIGPDATVLWPSFSERLDYELELGLFIGRAGKDIPATEAARHVAGYTIFNDFTARDIQAAEMQMLLGPAKGKDFDSGSAMGPYLVTPDEVDVTDLAMTARVNGEVWSQGSSSTMYWTFDRIIEGISRCETLHPGDFIGSGTVGKGCGADLGRWLAPGDVVELEIQGLGVLRNHITKERT